jgi:hypothetical protein
MTASQRPGASKANGSGKRIMLCWPDLVRLVAAHDGFFQSGAPPGLVSPVRKR